MLPAFTAQIARGGPVTITHPEVERYFMLIPEAVPAGHAGRGDGRPGEVLVLDMGEQVRIVDLASTLIAMAERPEVAITFTGLRPGEKLSEDLFSRGDHHRPTSHDLVMATDVPPLGPAPCVLLPDA